MVILSLFPYTRAIQVGIIAFLKIPLRLGIIGLIIYVAIRLSYALIERLTSAFVKSSTLLTPETSERLQLRVSTISGVAKSIITFLWLGVGILLGLTALGIDIIPLLAGVSLIGVALSLASQSLIKDAINGFLIIMEDQYALGDVITVGDIGGLVENLNLRITQVRDAEGRLITIPNSEVKIVAYLSSRWSRADLNIPVEIIGCSIIRDQNGLALSSRNQYLSEDKYDSTLLALGIVDLVIGKIWVFREGMASSMWSRCAQTDNFLFQWII